MAQQKIVVIIPALNEEMSIGKVIQSIPGNWVDEIIVVNNNSTDRTFEMALQAGATVLNEPLKGYGYACLKGIEYLIKNKTNPDIIVFLDADFSDHPEELPSLVYPITENGFDMVIGSRVSGNHERGSMTIPQIFGNKLSTYLIGILYGMRFTDLGPFRAIRYEKLIKLQMKDKTYGWTVEMQLKAAKMKMRCTEVPVSYRRRIGVSKVSGTVSGSVKAGYKILLTIFKHI